LRLSHFFIVAVVVRELRQGYGAARGPTPKAAVGTAIASTSARDFICIGDEGNSHDIAMNVI
jgi:hypothetical protein